MRNKCFLDTLIQKIFISILKTVALMGWHFIIITFNTCIGDYGHVQYIRDHIHVQHMHEDLLYDQIEHRHQRPCSC